MNQIKREMGLMKNAKIKIKEKWAWSLLYIEIAWLRFKILKLAAH